MKIIRSLTEVVLLMLILGMYMSVPAQEQKAVIVRQVIDQSGWEIPGLKNARVSEDRHPLPAGYGVQTVPLQITVLKPAGSDAETVALYSLKDDGRTVVVQQRGVAVRTIIKCEINNKVFVYIVQFANLVYDDNSKTVGQSGLFGLLYYDNDGDGTFESRESGPPVVSPDLRIPEWALKAAK